MFERHNPGGPEGFVHISGSPIGSAQGIADLGPATGDMELKKRARPHQYAGSALPLDPQLKSSPAVIPFLDTHEPLLRLGRIGPGRVTPVAHHLRVGEDLVNSRQIRFAQKAQGETFGRDNDRLEWGHNKAIIKL